MRKHYYLPLCVLVLSLAGCGDNGLSSDEKEERDPLIKTAQAYMEQNRWDEAEQTLKQALDKDPQLAKPHLELALIYQQHKPNFVHAIYHYDRYLELRPDSEKTGFIREQRAKVQQALEAESIQNSAKYKQLVAQAQRILQDNETLRKQLAAATQAPKPAVQTTPATEPAARTAPVAATTPKPATPKPATHQIYTVAAGDTLSKIAKKFYNDPARWDTIYEANKDSLSSPSSLRVGQSLVIPALGN